MKKIEKSDIFAFISTLILMLITHGFSFANLMYSHDSLFFYVTNEPQKVDYGRTLYPFIVSLRGLATPWMMGFFSSIYVAVSVVLVVRLLNFDKIKSLCVSLLFATNISLISLFSAYIYDGDANCLALLLACFAAYSFDRFSNHKEFFSITAIILCLMLYQAFIGVTVGLFLLLLIIKASKCKNNKDVHSLFLLGTKMVLSLLASAIIYIILMTVFANIFTGGLIGGYNGAGNIYNLNLQKILISFPKSYYVVLKNLLKPAGYNGVIVILSKVYLLISIIILGIIYIKKNSDYLGSLRIIIPCVILLPMGINAIYLVSFGLIHQLMIFSFCFLLILPLVLWEIISDGEHAYSSYSADMNSITRIIGFSSVIAIIVIGYNNINYANGAYVYKKLVYDNTLLHAHQIWKDVNSLDGYDDGKTPVVFIGEFEDSKASYNGPVASKYEGDLLGGQNVSITYDSSIGNFYSAILGRDLNFQSNNFSDEEMKKYFGAPVYPQQGYCFMEGDTVIVKMADIQQ